MNKAPPTIHRSLFTSHEVRMNRIVHLALKVEDLEKTTEFYQRV